MSILNTPDTVTVWLENGIPDRLVWDGIRYFVTDTPTPIRGSILHDLLTHPLEPLIGWRFQGTSETGESHVFDVHGGARQEWRLVAVYD
jgi:hypothetical protein